VQYYKFLKKSHNPLSGMEACTIRCWFPSLIILSQSGLVILLLIHALHGMHWSKTKFSRICRRSCVSILCFTWCRTQPHFCYPPAVTIWCSVQQFLNMSSTKLIGPSSIALLIPCPKKNCNVDRRRRSEKTDSHRCAKWPFLVLFQSCLGNVCSILNWAQ